MIEPFELELLGGGWERRYRRARPEVEELPWGTLGAGSLAAREHWTLAAFQEHATAAMCGEMLRLLVACRAPLDLIAHACRFPLDELVHVELCARLASELGGAIDLRHDSRLLAPPLDDEPLYAAAELAIRVFCVGEAASVPILTATWRATTHPLPRAVLGIIVRDEAPHGAFGWAFLDWAEPRLDPAWRPRLARAAADAIGELEAACARLADGRASGTGAELGWLEPAPYLAVARRAIADDVVAPLRARGLA